MNGLYTGSGIDYQRETFLFLILKYLQERSLIDAKFEIFNVDFSITIKEGETSQVNLYEAKEGKLENLKSKCLKELLNKLHSIYDNNSFNQFFIVYSLRVNKVPKYFRPFWIFKNICKERACNKTCRFPSSIKLLFIPRNELGKELGGNFQTDLQLRSIDIIQRILVGKLLMEKIEK